MAVERRRTLGGEAVGRVERLQDLTLRFGYRKVAKVYSRGFGGLLRDELLNDFGRLQVSFDPVRLMWRKLAVREYTSSKVYLL